MQLAVFVFVLVSVVTAGISATATEFTDPVNSSTSENSASSNISISEHAMGSCRLQIANLFGGHLDAYLQNSKGPANGAYYLPATGPLSSGVLGDGFGLVCLNANDSDSIAAQLDAKQLNGKWLRYSFFDDSWVPFEEQQHAHVISLHGVNWSGTGIIVDDVAGDERYRQRIFRFCLIRGTNALCGKTPIAYLTNPKVNELWKIRAILQSVKFLDGPIPDKADGSVSGKFYFKK